MNESYFRAAVPEPYRILGLTLKPFSLGRYRLLKRFGCAFVAEGEERADVGDLLLGVLVCAQRCDEFLELANSPAFSKTIKRWRRKISPWPLLGLLPGFVGRWWRERHSFDVVEKLRLFQRYIEAGSVMPEYWDQTQNPRGSGAHWAQSVEVALRGELGWSAEEINEQPLTKAFEDYFKWAENQGHVQLMTEGEIAMIEAAKSGQPQMDTDGHRLKEAVAEVRHILETQEGGARGA